MAHDNMKKWLSVVADAPSAKQAGMITEDVEGALKGIHSDVLKRPERSATPDKVTARVAGGMRGVSHDEVKKGFDSLSKKNGFNNFADELNSAKGAHDEEMHVAEGVVDEDDMEEGNEFSGKLAQAKKQGKKSFEVDGKTYPVKEGEEPCPVCEAMPCECDGSKEEMISEEWNIIYDSAYAKNVPARIRLKAGMDESAVREWFNKAFQPLNIHEVFNRTKMDPSLTKPQVTGQPPKGPGKGYPDPKKLYPPITGQPPKGPGKGNPKGLFDIYKEEQIDEFLAPLAAGAARVGGALAQGARAVGGAVAQGARALGTQVAANALDNQQQQQQNTAAASKLPKGMNIVLDKTGRVIQGPGKGQKFQGVSVLPESSDRAKRGDVKSVDVKDLLDDIHMRLDGNYDLKNQQQVIHSVAKLNDMPYETLLTHWFEDSDGLNKEETAATDIGNEMPPAEMPPAPEAGQEALPGEELVAPAQGQEPAPEEEPVMEAHAVTLHIEDDHEVKMAQSSLYQVAKDAAALHVMLDGVDNLEGWVQSKITLATDYIARVRDYMEYETLRNSEMPSEEHHYEDEIFEDREIPRKKKK